MKKYRNTKLNGASSCVAFPLSLSLSGALIGVSLFSGAILASNTTSADVVDDVVITVPVSCNMTSELDTAHTATINPGQNQTDIGTTNFTVFCNDNSGYAIYAIGYSNEEYGNTKLLATINNQLSPTNDIVTGTATSGATSNWSMKLTPVTGTYVPTIESDTNGSFASYHIVPTEYTKVATFASNTDFTIGSSLQSTYQAYISGTQPAGTYAGKVKYTMVHPASEVPPQPQTPTAGCINYFANASDAVGTMGCQSATDNASVTLLASNFSRNGYGFAGWTDAFDYKTNANANFYGPNETITAPVGTTANGLALYAVWVKSEGNLQSWSGCSSLTSADEATNILTQSITALTDQRDNDTYAIAKLADDNCWIIENLRLESTNSDNSTGALAQGYGGQFAGLADAEPAWANNLTTANSLYYSGTQDGTATIDIGTSSPDYRFPRYNHDNTNSRASTPTANTAAMYSYGNYYTWSATIADTTAYSSGDHNTTSICPTGWKIPLGNTSTGDIDQGAADSANKVPGFSYLDRKMGGTGANQSTAADSLRWRKYPVNFVYSGRVFSGSVSNRGSYGRYWSSTTVSSSNAYGLYFYSSSVYPGTGGDGKYYGWTVRCVASGA